jgi:branched-chain amino acid transport system ATP-binding protein
MSLTLERVSASYGAVPVLRDVSLRLEPGEVLCLLGRNGAGKTTTVKTVMGLVRPRAGRIALDGRDLAALRPHEIPRLGLAYVPQGRRLFPFLSVAENLRMGLLVGGHGRETLDSVLGLFPILRDRLPQAAGTLSGGEQQMLATARALCARPRVLLMDEPTEGLAPLLVRRLLETIVTLRDRGVGVLLVEQRVEAALSVADRAVLMENGQVRFEGPAAEVQARPDLLLRYVGVKR